MTTTQEHITEAGRQGQEAVLNAVRTWSENVGKFVTALPNAGAQVPTLEEVVDNVFGLAEQLLQAQHDFARNLITAISPAIDAATGAAAETIDLSEEKVASS